MARQVDKKIDRTIEFWSNKRLQQFLLTQPTIDILKDAITTLQKQKRFKVLHIQALNLAVSLFEAQLRDCLRLFVDSPRLELDYESEFLKINIDPAMFAQMRSRRFTLGEFVFINTSISSIGKLWGAVTFCFPHPIDEPFQKYLCDEGLDIYSVSDLKRSLSWVFTERNRYVHEFIDETALRIGKDKELDVFDKNINRAYHFISFIQNQKVATFNREYNEDHHHRGKIAKKINVTNKRIKRRIAEMYAFLQSLPADSKYSMQIEALRSSMERLFSIYEEYVSAVAEFAYISYGPQGSIRSDLAYGVTYEQLIIISKMLKRACDDMHSYVER
jgi:hypothetical protein